MKKISFFIPVIVLVVLSSCGGMSSSQENSSEPKENQTVVKKVSTPPTLQAKDNRPSSITVTPTEFGLTVLSVEKYEEGECGAKGNIRAYFQVSFTDSISTTSAHLNIDEYDCGDGKDRESSRDSGKRTKEIYELLSKSKAKDLAITYIYDNGNWRPTKMVIKEKRTLSKDGSPSKVEPEVSVTGSF